MGCSPSKGQLFSKKALLSGSPESQKTADLPSDGAQLQIKEEINTASKGLEIQENANHIEGKRSSVDDVVCDAAVIVEEEASEKMLDVVRSQDEQEGLLENQKEGIEEIQTKDKREKRRRQRKQRLTKNSCAQSKAEFILKAHQAAYAYLNPSISKYESLLGLVSQAAQTHLSVQTAVAAAVVHYEEINQALEEMATEGELLLREHGHNMKWPALLKDYPPTTKPSNDLNQLPSELLQHMLLHSTVQVISVGDSVKCLSDAALQELADYVGSLSEVLGEKLRAKHAAEERLKQVLSRVEAAALRNPGPEDSALHSEDSGIGADNECQNGFRRNRGSSGSGANAGITSVFTTGFSPDQQLHNANEEGTDNDDDDEDEDDEDAEIEDDISGKDELGRLTDKTRGTMYGSSEANSSFPPDQGGIQNQDQVTTSNLKRKIGRPKTADNTFQIKLKHRYLRRPKRSQSAECLCSKAEESDPNEEQGNPRNMHWRRKNNLQEDHGGHVRTKMGRGSSVGQCSARYYGLQYGSKGPFRALQSSSPPKFTPEPPGRHAVKRLINTFSQGVEDHSRQSSVDHRSVRVRGNKKCSLPLLQTSREALTTSRNIKSSICSLEPRPADKPEHLDIDSLPPPPPEMLMDNTFESSVGCPAEDRARNSQCRGQRLRTLTQRETAPPNRAHIQRAITQPLRPDALQGSCIEQEYNAGLRGSATHQGCKTHNEGETATMHSKGFPPTTPPVSRTRLPPSCPTLHHPVPTPQSTTPPVSKTQLPPSCPSLHHPVPSPPSTTCPPTGKWTPSNTSSVSGSQGYVEARAVFCQENPPLPHTWTPACTSTLPRPWGEPARPRLQTSFMGLLPSGHRSSHTEPPQSLPDAKQQQGPGSDDTPSTSEGTLRADLDTHGQLDITHQLD
ncbi:uncharacterized protein pcare2 [Siphateles boraxobius]|uniref:uncharacterized protein pcare2 n=1 Tax=Siphateles boraxobius TaxID=180520 RepID=UPI004062A5B5